MKTSKTIWLLVGMGVLSLWATDVSAQAATLSDGPQVDNQDLPICPEVGEVPRCASLRCETDPTNNCRRNCACAGQELRGTPPAVGDQRPSPTCPLKEPAGLAFPECFGKSNQECWDKCRDNGYQDGHCRFRNPDREPNANGVIKTPWGLSHDWYHNFKPKESHCLNPGEPLKWSGPNFVLSNYCQKTGHWRNVNYNGAGYPGFVVKCRKNTVTFEVLKGDPEIEFEEVHTDGCNDSSFCVRGRRGIAYTRTFNTPFIYFDGAVDGSYAISIDSEFDEYRSIPEFNAENGWNVEVVDGDVQVDGTVTPDLFYELDLSEVTLSRNGVNFEGREAMLEYLETSDFYQQLGMSKEEASNSFQYIQENLKDAPYYYLTIMDDEAVAEVSSLDITGPDGAVETGRRYFAIYPSQVSVTTTGGLQFPVALNTSIKEYGEIIVQPSMQVFWKSY